MATSPTPRRPAVLDQLNELGWVVSARRSERIATSGTPGTPTVRVNVVTGDVAVRGHGWSVAFGPDVPDHVVLAAAEARPETVGLATREAA